MSRNVSTPLLTPNNMASAAEPLSRALKQKRTEADVSWLPHAQQTVAAIDFGTTFVSLAYTTRGDDKVNTFKLNSTFERVPNAILLDGNKCVVEDFGFKAQDTYCKVRPRQLPSYIYFERIKMLLERDEVSIYQLNLCH